MEASQQLHLVIDDALLGGPADRVLRTFRVPDSVSFLHASAPDEQLLADAGPAGSLVVEPLLDGGQPRLLVLTPPDAAAPTVNGRSAPRVCLLRPKDQLLLDSRRILHLTVFYTPRVGPATKKQAGLRCPICRTPIREGCRVFTCPCDVVLHHDDKDASNALACAKLPSECPNCRIKVRLEGGFQDVPDLD